MKTILEKQGNFTGDNIEPILTEIRELFEGKKIKRKIFMVSNECLENICKYCDVYIDDDMDEGYLSRISIKQDEKEVYHIETGNVIYNDEIEDFTDKVDMVNNYSPEELRRAYSQTVMEGDIHDRGGAGLGLLEMAKRACSPLKYEIKKINTKLSYLSMKVDVCENK